MADTGGAERVESELDPGAIVAAVWSRKWLILAVTLAALAAGGLYAMAMPAQYEASAKLVPPPPANLEGPLGVADIELAYGERERWLTRLSAYRRGLMQLADPATRKAALADLAQRGFDIDAGDPAALEGYLQAIRVFNPREPEERSRILAFDHADGEFAVAVVEALIARANADASVLFADELRVEMDGLARMLRTRLEHLRDTSTGDDVAAAGAPALEALRVELETRVATLEDYVQRDYPALQMLGVEGGVLLSDGPVRPRILRVLVFAGIAGLFLGVMFAALAAARDSGGR